VRELRAGRPQKNDGLGLRIADIGTGTGCIAIALAKELPQAAIVATDVSAGALTVARRNAARHGVADRIRFLECNLLDGLRGSTAAAAEAVSTLGLSSASEFLVPLQRADADASFHQLPVTSHQSPSFELIASNPPYIGRREGPSLMREVRDHEPEIALYGGEEGHELYAELIEHSAAHLKPRGILVLELGHNSLPAVKPLLDEPIWKNVGITNDLAGIPRVLSAEKT